LIGKAAELAASL